MAYAGARSIWKSSISLRAKPNRNVPPMLKSRAIIHPFDWGKVDAPNRVGSSVDHNQEDGHQQIIDPVA
ncbi:hypothetical protein Vqi01_42720 [Micromonospora qiuiae]|uniref:Uncharacterized protein n=1 Tax=Micromonospora qiuiae TaxID=502268 RepID=A0ABQ4JFJ5_9ACTN|nr:hypothetical protein Vqi01_42720 [Micromonospora qiuiae]